MLLGNSFHGHPTRIADVHAMLREVLGDPAVSNHLEWYNGIQPITVTGRHSLAKYRKS